MGRENKRKSRLNKGESGEFLGFAAFAAPAAAPAENDQMSSTPSVTLSPIYTGSDSSLSLLFPRIGQKRDAITIGKALGELRDYFAEDSKPKKQQIEALCHFCYLYHSKLHYDSTARVRAGSLECFLQASLRIPKAWKTLSESQQPEILGMVLASRADPAADVRLAATQLAEALTDDIQIDQGVWDYSKRILLYGKAKSMHEELFQKSSESGLSEKQKEELEERFERIVGTAIGGLQNYLLQNYAPSYQMEDDVKFLWRALSSNKASLRRKTYGLLATACQKAQALVDKDKTAKLMMQSLGSEKEPTNIPSLLETLISFVSTQEDRSATMAMFAKPLAKLFKKGCLGATQWSPAVLPIVVILPLENQPNVLTSVWEGRGEVAGLADELEIVAAVAETATFLLQKDPHDFGEVIGKCWLQSLDTYLKVHATGPAQRSLKILGETLARDWNQLNVASHEKTSSMIHHLKDWFWKEQLPQIILDDTVDTQLLLELLRELESKEDIPNQWAFILKQKFHLLLSTCQGSSGLVPSSDKYELWIAILKSLSPSQVFDSSDDLDKFFMNDLLRWMVIHTSSVSEQASSVMAKKDFAIYKLCSTSQGIWDSILRELVAANCDLKHLQAGLSILMEGSDQKLVQSPVLDEFCIQVATDSLVEPSSYHIDDEHQHHSDASEELYHEQYEKTTNFLKMCSGLDHSTVVIQESTIQAWIDSACPNDNLTIVTASPVLDTLVLLSMQDNRLDEGNIHRVMLQSWRQGGNLWNDSAIPFLAEKSALQLSLIELASKEVKSVLNQAASWSKEDDDLSQMWSERSVRLLRLCSNGETSNSPDPSLALVGFADEKLWRRNEGKGSRSFVAQCLMKLLLLMDDVEDRRRLFSNFESGILELFINILLNLSGADPDALRADLARRRKDACAMVLQEVGAVSLEFSQIEQWCRTCIVLLVSLLKEESTDERICRGIAVLSQLLELIFKGLRPSEETGRNDNLKQGDTVWYISNSEDPTIGEQCTIVKVHTDLPSEVYFTIKLSRDGVTQERQTVGDRLRKAPFKSNTEQSGLISVKEISSDERSQRCAMTNRILDNLTTPFWESWRPSAFELLSILISQSGVLGDRGIGTEHHMIFQKLMNLQVGLLAHLSDETFDKKELLASLQKLSLALGYGCNAPSAPSQALVSFKSGDSIKAIISYYEDTDKDRDAELESAMAAWLTVSAPSLEDEKLREQAYTLQFRLSAQLLEDSNDNDGFCSNHFIALRAIQAAQCASHKFKSGESLMEDSEAESLLGMVTAFSSQWELVNTENPSSPLTWQSNQIFDSVFDASLRNRRSLMARASRPCIDKLVECLYTDSKRWNSMKLLLAYANEGVPIHSEPGDLNKLTENKIELWCKECKLIDEEVEELEDDIDAVAQWIPEKLMNHVEGWYEADKSGFVFDDKTICGRMLSWMAFLQIAEVASGKDAINRPAFTSYVTKCKAIEAMLSLALLYANVGTERKVSLEKVLDIDEILVQKDTTSLSELASFVIFRSIEVFPTIAKNWWEMGCPNYMTQPIRDFVESNVSPVILRRELDRIKQTSSFGAMNVKGSLMSREVTATYVQDDFTLTVIIQIPLSFPFRRAEVDCSKTYGVPESRWKRWSLQITQMLNNQGGTLSDVLLLWKENVDKEFEGVEPCPVCYSVLQVKTHKLPGVECNTCHNRFHIDCLSQWFRSSGKNDCVLCQQPWSGKKVQ